VREQRAGTKKRGFLSRASYSAVQRGLDEEAGARIAILLDVAMCSSCHQSSKYVK